MLKLLKTTLDCLKFVTATRSENYCIYILFDYIDSCCKNGEEIEETGGGLFSQLTGINQNPITDIIVSMG